MKKKNNYTKWERDGFLLGEEPKGIGYPRDCVFEGDEYHPVLSTRVGWRKNREWLFRYAENIRCFAPGSFLAWRDHWVLLKQCFGRHFKPVMKEFITKFSVYDDDALSVLDWDVTGQHPYNVPIKTRYAFEGFFESLKSIPYVKIIRHPWPNKEIIAERTFGDAGVVNDAYYVNICVVDADNHLRVEIGHATGWWIDTNTEEANEYGQCAYIRPQKKDGVYFHIANDSDDEIRQKLLEADNIYLSNKEYIINFVLYVRDKWRTYYEGR